MRRSSELIVVALLAIPGLTLAQPADSLDQLIAGHIEALGGIDAIRAVRSRVVRGTYAERDFSVESWYANQRPFYRVTGDPGQPNADLEGYDGSAWECYTDPGVVLRTVGAAARATRRTAAFDDPLIDHRELGTQLTDGGMRELDGKPVHVIHAVLSDGYEMALFLDPRTYLIVGDQRLVRHHAFGSRIVSHNLYDDYRPEGGVMMWHRTREIDSATGEELSRGTITSVEINRELPLSMFSPPPIVRTTVQRMIQQLYDERDDGLGVLATYRQYRRAYPDLEYADAVDFVGFQILKMEQVETAVELLLLNAADHPTSARAQFGSGRALETAGRRDEARAAYEAALRIDPSHERARAGVDRLSAP